MNAYGIALLANVSAAGAGAGVNWNGGRGAFTAVGTFGGTAATLEIQSVTGAWVPVTSAAGTPVSLSAAGYVIFEAPPGTLRAVLTGGAPVNVYANADRIPS